MRSLVVGTAGHIDHGKSALVEALTGTDPDRLKEEKARGITIELGFAHATIDDVAVAFVDVPGHERFVRTMLAGVGSLDAVLLVVAADESVMPQTREHFEICRLLGVTRGVIVLTKSDLADRDTLEITALEARELVAGSALAGAPVVAVSARTGAGLDDLRRVLGAMADGPARQVRTGVARVPVDRVFTVKGFGTVATGTLVSGTIREGEVLAVLPSGLSARVRGLQVHGRTERSAAAPRRVAVNFGGVDLSKLSRGMTLAAAGTLAVTRRADVYVEVLKGVRALRHGARVRLHQGTSEMLGRVAIAAVRSPADDDWEAVSMGRRDVVVAPGGSAFVRLRLERPVVLTRGDRFVLRASSPVITIGGGIVLDPEPPASGVRRPATLARFQQLHTDAAQAARVWLREAGLAGYSAADLVRRGGVSPEEADGILADLIRTGDAALASSTVISAARVRELERALAEALATHHRLHPMEDGVAREALRDRVATGAPAHVFDAVVTALVQSGQVTGTDRLALASHRPHRSAEDVRVTQMIDRSLRAAGYQPPDLATLATEAMAPADVAVRILHGLVRDRVVVKVDTLWFHRETLDGLKAEVTALGTGARLDVAAVKTRYGISRKFAIPLLEYLDRERVTRRVGDARVVI